MPLGQPLLDAILALARPVERRVQLILVRSLDAEGLPERAVPPAA